MWDLSSLLLLLLSHFSCVRLCVTHRRQPTRLRRPWDSPGNSTGVGCHFLLQCMKVKSGDLSLPLGLALGSPIFPSGCEGKLGVALESLQGLRDLT